MENNWIEINPNHHYTVDSVAEMMDIKPLTVTRRIISGDLKAGKFGWKTMLKGEDILSYIYNNK